MPDEVVFRSCVSLDNIYNTQIRRLLRFARNDKIKSPSLEERSGEAPEGERGKWHEVPAEGKTHCLVKLLIKPEQLIAY